MKRIQKRFESTVVGLPPLSVVAKNLRIATEFLARELASPGTRPPSWNEFEWRLAQAVAAIHGISPLLSTRLRWQGPERWQRFLQEQKQHTLERHQRLSELLRHIDTEARRAAIAIAPLKGAALHALGVYAAGERPMADLDFLVAPQDFDATTELLSKLGYAESIQVWKHKILEPRAKSVCAGFGEHSNNPVKIDLHQQIKERLPLNEIDITPCIFPAVRRSGMNSYASIAALMKHLLLHAAGNMQGRGLRLIQLHDIALLSTRMTSSDWMELLQLDEQGRRPWWALPPLRLLQRYYPSAAPPSVLAVLRPDCPWILRKVSRRKTLTDVSLSGLHIQALPGIAWCSSAPEFFNYTARRFRPSREDLEARKYLVRSHAWAAQQLWPSLPQWRRIARWARSRPPRAETLFMIHAALQDLR